MKFEVSGKRYEFDPDPARLMGDEFLLVEDHLGMPVTEWGQRLTEQKFGVRDILLITYLAARRQGERAEWAEFIRTVAPLTFRTADDTPEAATAEAAATA